MREGNGSDIGRDSSPLTGAVSKIATPESLQTVTCFFLRCSSSSVDVVVLADMLELICEDVGKKENGILTFSDVVDLILSMRGTNTATVKDCKEQIRMTKMVLKKSVDELSSSLKDEFVKMKYELGKPGDSDDDDD